MSLFKTGSTAESQRTLREIFFFDPIVRGDWIKRLFPSEK